MKPHTKVLGFALALIMLIMLAVPMASTEAGRRFVGLPGGWVAEVYFCRDGYSITVTGTLATNVTTTVTVLSTAPSSAGGEVLTFTGPGSVNETYFFPWDTYQEPGVTAEILIDRLENGVSLTLGAGRYDTAPISNCVIQAYAGPALPGPSARNLVVVTSSTPILTEPGGAPTGLTMEPCKTAFIIDEQGIYGELFVMGGWIDMGATVDVAEDYGQPNGQPLLPGCY